MTIDLISFPHGIYALDSGYMRPGMAAVHFIVRKGRVAVVDTAHNAALPLFMEALSAIGLDAEAVDYLFLTHVHLDHAGGAGAYMARLPNAKLVAHPRGARHMIDPDRLVSGASAVYGAEEVRRLYGTLIPVPNERVIEAADDTVFWLADRPLQCLHTEGHARHHLCLWDQTAGACFSGDAFGAAYREMEVNGYPFILPATTPVQFDPNAMKNSIRRLLNLKPEAIYLTHFSRVEQVERLGADLLRRVDQVVAMTEALQRMGEGRKEALSACLLRAILDEAPALDPARIAKILATDLDLNAQGLLWWLDHRQQTV